MYHELETIIDYYMSWTLEDAKKLSVRERKHWYKRVKRKIESLR